MSRPSTITYFPAMAVAAFYWLMVLIHGRENHNASVEDNWEWLGTLYIMTAWFGTIILVIFVVYLIFKKRGERINF